MDKEAYQGEIDGGNILGSTTRAGHTYKVKTYNFKRPDKFSKDQIQTFRILHEEIARNMAPVLSSVLGEPVTISLSSVDQLTFQELIESAAEIESYAIFNMKPLRGNAIVQIDPRMAHAIVHRACGGASFPSIPARGLTETESIIVLDTFEEFVPALNDAWSRIVPLDCGVSSIESDKQQILIMPGPEMIILAVYSISVGDMNWYFTITVPYMTLESVVDKLTAVYWFRYVRSRGNTASAGSRIADLNASTELSIDLGTLRLSDLPAIVAGEPCAIPENPRIVLSAGGVEVAELEPPESLVDLPEDLAVKTWINGKRSESLLHPSIGDTEASIVSTIDRVLSPIQNDLRELQTSVNELIGARVENRVPELGDESVGFAQSQIRDVSITLSGESEQTTAFVLSPLEPTFSAGVLTLLPEQMQSGVIARIETLGDASKSLHRRVVSLISRRAALALKQRISGGTEAVVKILNQAPRSVEKRVMDYYKKTDEELFERIARRMFVFEDFVLIDVKALQKLSARIAPDEFALALKGAAAEVRKHFMTAFESDYAEEVQSCLGDESPARLKDVEAMQREIIEELRQLEKAGEVIVARPEETVT